METTTIITLKNTNVGNDNNNIQYMTSLEIAELTGKQHKDVLKAIRNMEPSWLKVCGRNFALTSRTIVQPNGGTREVPCYQLTKTFNMSVFDFNHVLSDMGIQYRRHGRWNISDDLSDRDLVRLRTHVSYSLKGEKKVRTYMTWTMAGLHYLNSKLGYPNF